ncbi:hypothetical protein TNCV_3218561 [Trichonephila clavipes]|nr:hypothetical protein TNCV_3218561 [Trichonephila clavipes]
MYVAQQKKRLSTPGLEHRSPGLGFDARSHQIASEYTRRRARYISRSESPVGGRSRNHRCRVLENISLPSSPCPNCGGRDRLCRHLSCRSPNCLRLWQLFPLFHSGRTRQQQQL